MMEQDTSFAVEGGDVGGQHHIKTNRHDRNYPILDTHMTHNVI